MSDTLCPVEPERVWLGVFYNLHLLRRYGTIFILQTVIISKSTVACGQECGGDVLWIY